MGTITVVVSCPDPSLLNKSDTCEVNLKPACKENESAIWPTITLVINLTSPIVVQKNEAAPEDKNGNYILSLKIRFSQSLYAILFFYLATDSSYVYQSPKWET